MVFIWYPFLKGLSQFADLSAAISLEAYDGRLEPFFDCLQQIRPHEGQKETALTFRRLLEGSQIISQAKEHIQDPYSFPMYTTGSRCK